MCNAKQQKERHVTYTKTLNGGIGPRVIHFSLIGKLIDQAWNGGLPLENDLVVDVILDMLIVKGHPSYFV